MLNKKIIMTTGEPAGIGPSLAVMLAQKFIPVKLVVCADSKVLLDRAKYLNLPLKIKYLNDLKDINNYSQNIGELTVLEVKTRVPVLLGKLNQLNSSYVINTINIACDQCIEKKFDALITGPVNKDIINKAGFLFSGHTEYLRYRSNVKNTIMMLVNKFMRVALMTTHIPLSSVSNVISEKLINKTVILLFNEMKKKFGIKEPEIYVCGLNPHAGENGLLGKEEIEIIIPALNKLRKDGYRIFGPLPADTIFQKKYLGYSSVVLTMYHDQGLPVIKYCGLKNLINITLGLPFIRTSVGHGTALDMVNYKKIDSDSIETVLQYTLDLINKK